MTKGVVQQMYWVVACKKRTTLTSDLLQQQVAVDASTDCFRSLLCLCHAMTMKAG